MAFIFSASLYGSLLLGYHWTAQEQEWAGLRARFSPVGSKPLIVGAAAAIGMIALTWMTALLLKWVGIKIADVPISLRNGELCATAAGDFDCYIFPQ